MSFSNSMKSDLSRVISERKCCLFSELASMIKTNGVITEGLNGESILRLITENVNVAKRMYSFVKEAFKIHPGVIIRKSKKLKEHNVFIVSIDRIMDDNKIPQELAQLVLSETKSTPFKKNKELFKNICCKKSYLRGIFLGVGSITNPNNYYHVEIVFKDDDFANSIKKMLAKFQINAKVTKRKSSYIVYIKEADQICDFLNIIGAHKALLDIENIRILKDMRNSVNRIVNCETANLSKIVDASVRHVSSINFLKEINELDRLPKPLYEVACKRLKYPDYSLKELGITLVPTVGKSGVNHRLKKIDEIAQEFQKLREEQV